MSEPGSREAQAPPGSVPALLLVLLAFALVLRGQPIWSMGQYQDDAVLSSYLAAYAAHGRGLWDFSLDMFRSLALNQGRISPVSAFFVLPLWIWVEDNLFLYRVIQAAAQLAALGAFALFVRTVTRDSLSALLCVALYVAVLEVRDFHDASHSYFILLPYVVVVGCLACHFAVRATRSTRVLDRAVWMVVLMNLAGVLGYELAVPFAALSCLILLFWGELPWKARLARATLAGIPVAVMALVGLVAKAMLSNYEGTQLGSMQPAVLAEAWAKHVSGAIPLSYWWHDPDRHLAGLLLGTRSSPGGLLSAGALAAALAAIVYAALARARAAPASMAVLVVAGALLLLAPPALIALTLKYQRAAVTGVGYLQNAITYLGASVLLFAALHAASRAAGRVGPGALRAFSALAGMAVGLAAAIALLSSYRVAQAVNENWRYPREQLEVWMYATRPPPGGANQVLAVERPWLQRWETTGFVWQHWKVHGRFVTVAELAATGAKDRATVLRVPARPHPAAVNLYLDATPTQDGASVRALVMSTSRERLTENALVLSFGGRSWPLPDEVRQGRHGYYYRTLEVHAPAAALDDYRLTLAPPGRPLPAAVAEAPAPAKLQWVAGRFDDGWVTDRFELRNAGGRTSEVRVSLWNPTAQPRAFVLESESAAVRESLAPGARAQKVLTLAAGRSIRGSVTPVFVPRELGQGADDRRLGLRVDAEDVSAP